MRIAGRSQSPSPFLLDPSDSGKNRRYFVNFMPLHRDKGKLWRYFTIGSPNSRLLRRFLNYKDIFYRYFPGNCLGESNKTIKGRYSPRKLQKKPLGVERKSIGTNAYAAAGRLDPLFLRQLS